MNPIKQNYLSKTYAFALVVLFALFFYFITFHTFIKNNKQLSHDIKMLKEQRNEYSTLASSMEQLQQHHQSLQAAYDSESLVFNAENESLVSATMQNNISNIIDQSDATLLNMEILSASTIDNMLILPASLQFSASMSAFRNVLHTLENEKPFIYIKTMSIHSDPGSAYLPESNNTLVINMQIFSLMKPLIQ